MAEVPVLQEQQTGRSPKSDRLLRLPGIGEDQPDLMLPIHLFGIPYAGLVYDRTGSYDIAFLTFLGVYGLAMIAALFLRLPEVEPGSVRASEPVGADAAAAVAESGACTSG